MEEQDLFPQITEYKLSDQAGKVLRSQGFNVTQLQTDVDSAIRQGGAKKAEALSYIMQLSDKATGSREYQGYLQAAAPLTPQQRAASYGSTTGTQNFFGNLWNNSIPAVAEGFGKLVYGALPAAFNSDEKAWNARNQSVEDFISPMMTYVDESFKSLTPVEWDRETGSLNLENLGNTKAWANISSQVIGFLLPTLATAGVGGAVRAAGLAGTASEAINLSGRFGQIAEGVAAAGKLDKFGKALVATDMLTSTLQMFPQYQKEGLQNGLSIGQATAFALPTAIAAGAVEIIGGEALAKGLGFTAGTEGRMLLRDVMQMNTADALRTVMSKGWSADAMQEVVKGALAKTIDDMGNPVKRGAWQKLAESRLGRAAVSQGFAEGSEEAIQQGVEDMAKAIYNATTDKSVKAGQGRFQDFDSREFATNALFGAFLGGMMGTGMGMFHKSPKVFDQTLFSYINADVTNHLQRGNTDFDTIAQSLKANQLSQDGLSQGIYDAKEKANIDRKIQAMARAAYDFAQVKEFTPADRMAMFTITDTRDKIGARAAAIEEQKQAVANLQAQIGAGVSSSEAARIGIDIATIQKGLGGFNPQTNTYGAEDQLTYDAQTTEAIFGEVTQVLADETKRKGIGKYIGNELTSKSNVNRSPRKYITLPDGTLAVSESVEGKRDPIVTKYSVVPAAAETFEQKAGNGIPKIYQPTVRATLQPSQTVQSYDEWQSASAELAKSGQPMNTEPFTKNMATDAAEVLSFAQNTVATIEKDTPWEQSADAISQLYRYYKQIAVLDPTIPSYPTVRDFEAAIGFERKSDRAKKAAKETKGLIDRLDDSVKSEAIALARQYAEGYDGQNLPTHWKAIYDTLGSIKNLKDVWQRMMGNTDDYPFRYEARKDDTTADTLDSYVTGLQNEGLDIDEQDVIDFMQAYPGGVDRAKTAGLAPIRERFKEITGKTLNFPMAKRIVEENFAKEKEAVNEAVNEDVSTSDIEPWESEYGITESVFSEADFTEAGQLLDMLDENDVDALVNLAEEYQNEYTAGYDWVHILLANARAGLIDSFPPLSEEGQALIAEAARRKEVKAEEISYTNFVNQIINEYERREIVRKAKESADARTAAGSNLGTGSADQSEATQPTANEITDGEATVTQTTPDVGSGPQSLELSLLAEQKRDEVIGAIADVGERIQGLIAVAEQSSDEIVIAEQLDQIESLIDQREESIRQLEQIASEQSGDQNTGANGIEAVGENVGLSKAEQLDQEAALRKQRLRELAGKFAQAGRKTASSSLIGVTPEQIAIAGEMLGELTALGINRFEKAVVWLADNIGMDWLDENFEAFKMAYGAVKFARNDGEDLNAASALTKEEILANPTNYLPSTAESKAVTTEAPIQQGESLNKIIDETVETVGNTDAANAHVTASQLALFEQAVGSKTEAIGNRAANARTPRERAEVAKEAQAAIQDIDALIDAYFDNTGIRPNEVTEIGNLAADRKVRQAVTRLSKQLAKDLGLVHDADKKGRPLYANANIDPAGGDVSFTLWVDAATAEKIGKKVGIYVTISVDRDYETDNLSVFRATGLDPVMWRITDEQGRVFDANNFVPRDTKYADFKQQIINELTQYGYTQPQNTVPARRNDRQSSVSGAVQPGLFETNATGTEANGLPTANSGPGVESGTTTEVVSEPLQSGGNTGNSVGDAVSPEPIGTGGTGDAGGGVESVAEATGIEPTPKVVRNTQNFVITPETVLVPTGEVGKVRANIDAIKTLKRVKAENRAATEEEKKVLVQYVGWGGLAEYLNETRYRQWFGYRDYEARGRGMYIPAEVTNWGKKYAKLHEEILGVLSEEELRKAQGSTLNAHYTERGVINAMWQVLSRMGVSGGRFLEPSAGIGHFMGLMPEDIRVNSEISAVELDTTSGEIMKLLYPDADVRVGGFEEFQPPIGSYDLVVGNIPFGGYKVFDAQHEDLSQFPIHNYFIGKSAKLVRPNGIVALITTSGTMDAGNSKFRTWLREHNLALVSALRLPSSAFSENAGTEVTTDILFLQKFEAHSPFLSNSFTNVLPIDRGWLYNKKEFLSDSEYDGYTDEQKKDGKDYFDRIVLSVNEYFVSNPQNMLGEMKFAVQVGSGGLYRADAPTLYNPNKEDVQRRLAEYIASVPADIFSYSGERTQTTRSGKGRLIVNLDGKASVNGTHVVVDNEQVKLLGKSYTKTVIINQYAQLKEAYLKQLGYESDNHPDIEKNRAQLAKLYSEFTKKFGTLNENKALNFIEDVDIEFSTVQSLENVTYVREKNRRKATVTPSNILTQRVIQKVEEPTRADSLDDAIAISRSFRGQLDLEYVTSLMNGSTDTVLEEIIATGRGFVDPETGVTVFRDDYLSGNVRKKLYKAQKALESDARYQSNVDELQKILPPTKPISVIEFRLGSSWVPSHIIERFIASTLGVEVSVRYDDTLKEYVLGNYSQYAPLVRSMGTNSRDAIQLIRSALNSQSISIEKESYNDEGKKVKVKDVDAIAQAVEARENLNNLFVDFAKDNFAPTIEKIFNDTFNGTVEKEFSMPYFETYPNANPAIRLRDHQKRVVERTKESDTYYAHDVGTGKAQPLDAKILTPNGWVLMGDIKVGDSVITADGSATMVTGVFPQGEKEIFEVCFSDGSKTQCCDEHLWLTQTYKERTGYQTSLRIGKEWNFCKPKVRQLSEIRETLVARMGAKNHSIPVVKPVIFNERPLKIHPYVIGALIGNGCIKYGGVLFSSNDPDTINKFASLLPESVYLKKQDGLYDYRVTRKNISGINQVTDYLREYGLMGKGCEEKYIPDDYLFSSLESRIHLLHGLMDTDGTIDKRSGSASYSTSSNRLAYSFVSLVQSLGGVARIGCKVPSYTYKGEKKIGRLSYTISVTLPNEILPFSLSRKIAFWKPKSSYLPARYITEVRPVGKKQAQCISVAHESHLYVTDDYIVTHNTFSAITAVMEMKRLGRASKALLVVQNSTVEQFKSAFSVLYPGASVYVPDESDREAQNRRRFLQRIASNNFDAIVIPQSFLGELPDDPMRVEAVIRQEADELKDAIEAETEQGTKRSLQKRLAELEKRIEARRKKQASRGTDDILNFEQLGIDMVVLDEAHSYKRLGFSTKMANIKGIDTAGSERAFSALMKVRHIQEKGGRVVMMSGTPISNTMAEAWTIMKFISPDRLEELGIPTFDQFATSFGKVEPSFELTTTGNFKSVERFAKFVNVPELSSAFRDKIDVVLTSDVREFKEDNTIPKLKVQTETVTDEDGKPQVRTGPGYTRVILGQTEGIQEQLDRVRRELERFEKMSGGQKKQNSHIPLVMFGQAKKATLDLRLLSTSLPDEPGSKANKAVSEIMRIYQDSTSYKGAQLVFADLFRSPDVKDKYYTTEQGEQLANPEYGKRRFNLFEDIRDKLIRAGIPASEIAIVPEDKKRRQPVFDKVKTGEIRVLFGSSELMGVGVNVQDVLAGLHHLDAPARPTDFAQRNGRILRQGNTHAQMNLPVEILTYGVEKTLDATSYQRLAIKQKFIDQVLKGEISDQEMADISDEDEVSSMSFDQMMATLSGSQYAVLYTQAKLDLSRMVQRKKNWERSVVEAQRNIEAYTKDIQVYDERIPVLEAEVKLLKARFGETPKVETLEFGGKAYTEKWGNEFQAFLTDMVSRFRAYLSSQEVIRVNGALVKMEVIRNAKQGLFETPVIHYELGNEVAGEINSSNGFVSSITSKIASVYQSVDKTQSLRDNRVAALQAFTTKLNQPFKEEEQIKKLQARVDDLQKKMEGESKPKAEETQELSLEESNTAPSETTTNEQLSNLLTQLRTLHPDIAMNLPTEADFKAQYQRLAGNVTNTPYGFYNPNTNEVWLDPTRPNANTPIHEVGHAWVGWARNNRVDLWQRGIELVRDSAYYRGLKSSPEWTANYAHLTEQQLFEEALAIAIGNQGEAFVTNTRKRGFKEWLNELFDAVKGFLGIRSLDAEQIQRLDLDTFVKMVTADILAGEPITPTKEALQGGDLSPDAVSPVLFSFTQPGYDFAANANPGELSSFPSWSEVQAEYRSKIPPSILAKREQDLNGAERKYLKDLQAEYGYKYLGNGYSYLDLTESTGTFFTSDGGVAKMETFGLQSGNKGLIAQSALNSVVRLYNEKGWVGRMFRVLVDKFMKLTNVETLAELLDDGSGMMRSLITEVKRLGGRNKSYVTMLLNPLRVRLAEAMKDYSIANGINDIWNVQRVKVKTYAWDEALGVVEKEVEVPVATAMSLVLTAETQEASYQANSLVIQDRFLDPTTGDLLVNDRSVLFSQSKNVARGAAIDHPVLEDLGGGQYQELDGITLLLSKDELDGLRQRFYNGTQQETEAFALLKQTINNGDVLAMLKEENDTYLNPNTVFNPITDENGESAYWPIYSNDSPSATAQKQVGLKVNRTLEDSRVLMERSGLSQSVSVKDALLTMDEYQYRVENIVEHGRLAHNLKNIVNALQTDLGDNKLVKSVSDILLDRALLLEDYRKYKAEKRSHTQFEKIFNAALSRYTSSVFRLNFGVAFKQLATFYSASGQSLLEDKYLYNAKSYMNLFANSRGIFTDTATGVGQDVVEGTDIGFKDKLGNDSSQAALLRELLGEHIPDEAERQVWRRQMATVIDRVITANNQYIGGIDVDSFSWNDKGLGMLGKLFGKADAAMENVGMAPIKIGDRGVILAYYQAAKEQVADEVAAGTTAQADANTRLAEVMESVLYSTNQMNKVADLTYLQTDTNWLSKLVGLYSGQQQKLFNVFLQGFIDWARLRGLPDDDRRKIQAWDKVRKSFISNVIIVPLYMAGATVAWKMLRNALNGDEPEDEDYYKDLFLSSWANNGASVVPGITAQVLQSVISMVDGQPWTDAILDFPAEETASGTVEMFADLYNYATEDDADRLETIKNSLSYNMERSFAGWTGAPRVVTQFTKEFLTEDKDDKK